MLPIRKHSLTRDEVTLPPVGTAGARSYRRSCKCCAHVENTRWATREGDEADASFHSRFTYNLNYHKSKEHIPDVPNSKAVGY